MAGLFGGRRRRIREAYDALCDAIAAADGATAAAAEAARRRHLDALVELWLRTRGQDPEVEAVLPFVEHNPAFATLAGAVEADRTSAALRPAAAFPELDAIVAEAAPGSASRPPDEWLGKHGQHPGLAGVPRMWRVGDGHVGVAGDEAFDVAVPLLDESHLQVSTRHESRTAALGMVEDLLLRVVSHFRPGLVAVHLWDVAQITGPLPRLHPLTRTGIVTVHDPRGLTPLLDELADRVRRVHRRVREAGWTSVAEWVEKGTTTDQRPEPWTVAVLVGDRTPLRDDEREALARIARGGLDCGVQLVLVDVPQTLGASVETIDLDAAGTARASITGPHVRVTPERAWADELVARAGHAIAEEHESWRNRISTLADILTPDGERWKASSRDGLRAEIGFDDAGRVPVVLDDASPHALVGGPSGSGKTNLLLTWIASLTTRYSPTELELYLLDFKEGVSFAQFAPGTRDPSFLPHAKLVGLHVNTDREFGLALLQFLADEMRRRAAAAKEYEVTKLADLRGVAGQEHRWPRIVAVVDEFQYLFSERDSVSREAGLLLEDVARRGRSQGIHLVLASQDVSGIGEFWGRPAIFEQFVLRIALPRARRVLDDRRNEATLDLPRWHAVVNHESGMRHANRVARIPDASTPRVLADVQVDLHRRWVEQHAGGRPPEPGVFDGSRAPTIDTLLDRLPDGPHVLVGQSMDVEASAAAAALPRAPGRNLAVLGAAGADAVRVLGAAAAGMLRTADVRRVVLVPLVAEADRPEQADRRVEADPAAGTDRLAEAERRGGGRGGQVDRAGRAAAGEGRGRRRARRSRRAGGAPVRDRGPRRGRAEAAHRGRRPADARRALRRGRRRGAARPGRPGGPADGRALRARGRGARAGLVADRSPDARAVDDGRDGRRHRCLGRAGRPGRRPAAAAARDAADLVASARPGPVLRPGAARDAARRRRPAGGAMRDARDYRAAVAAMTEGVAGDSERNARRVAELEVAVRRLGRELEEASELRVAARVGNVLAWEAALEVLWVESWMTMRPFPKPDRLASGDDVADRITAVEKAVEALQAAVARRPLGLAGRR